MAPSLSRTARHPLAIGAVALALAAVCTHLAFAPAAARKARAENPVAIEIRARPLPGFDARDPTRRRFGPLEFRGGLELTSPHKDFGGISSLRMSADGERFLAVTDRGQWLRGRIRYDGDAPTGIADAEMAPILGQDGKPITARRRWYDSEAMTQDGGTVYVALERVHQILWFDYGKRGLTARGRPMRVPAEFRQMPSNKGIEGLVVAPKGTPLAGTLIALSEKHLDSAGNIRGFLLGGESPGTFAAERGGDFDITDAALTPRGDLIILERSFSLWAGAGMRLRRVALADIRPGALVKGVVLVQVDSGYRIDNMEGLSVHTGRNGEMVLTIVSDDNFSSLQRTLLLQFTLLEP